MLQVTVFEESNDAMPHGECHRRQSLDDGRQKTGENMQFIYVCT